VKRRVIGSKVENECVGGRLRRIDNKQETEACATRNVWYMRRGDQTVRRVINRIKMSESRLAPGGHSGRR
jgi:hypothetical protein